ncbi:MAG: hypothetical protein U5M23_01270 [Marinagarivorans sp.]|nr:hypothetical protein [Marinagarivorans sp.]
MTLAVDDALDPEPWELRVFQDRANVWENFDPETAPIINVWWDQSSFDQTRGDTVDRQCASATFNIDCYGYGVATGNEHGDKLAADSVHRALRLARNILMSAHYTYLGMRGIVWRRWVESVQTFQPAQDNGNVMQVIAGRIQLRVEFNEFSPQVIGQPLEYVHIDVKRAENGQVIAAADFITTP